MSDSHPTPRPDCWVTTHKDTTWRTTPLSAGLLAFYEPCKICFPDGDIDVETVVRSGCHGNVLHRSAPVNSEVTDR